MNAKIQVHVNRIVQTEKDRLNVLVPLDTFWKMIENHAQVIHRSYMSFDNVNNYSLSFYSIPEK